MEPVVTRSFNRPSRVYEAENPQRRGAPLPTPPTIRELEAIRAQTITRGLLDVLTGSNVTVEESRAAFDEALRLYRPPKVMTCLVCHETFDINPKSQIGTGRCRNCRNLEMSTSQRVRQRDYRERTKCQ